MDRIGTRLVAEGLIDREQLQAALRTQRIEGGYLGQHLIDSGAVDRRAFHEALSRHWSLMQRDLVVDPPRPELLVQVAPEESLERGWVPCDLDGDSIVVATAVRPAPELVAEVEDHFPGRAVEFVACTRRDLDAVALGVARQRSLEAGHADQPVRRPETRARHFVAAVLSLLVVIAVMVALPVDLGAVLVLAAGAVFLVGVGIQVILGLDSFARELDESAGRRPSPRSVVVPDPDLPRYSVLVRLAPDAEAPARALALVEGIDYPRARLDVLWLVDDDSPALAAVGGLAPPESVRVVRIAPGSDEAGVLDQGLALARGRYVVAYRDTDRPAADQLKLGAGRFEEAVAQRLDGRGWQPLLGLRVHLRSEPGRRSTYERLAAIDFALRLDRGPDEVLTALVGREVRGTHFNMRLLRRAGGFVEVTLPPPVATRPSDQPRVEELDSTTVVDHALTTADWMAERARSAMVSMPGWFHRLRGAVLSPVPERGGAWDAVRATSVPLMFLPLPPLLVAALIVGVRSGREQSFFAEGVAWLVLGETALMLGAVTMFASVVLSWRRGTSSLADLVLILTYWVLASVAFWAATMALVVRYRHDRGRHRLQRPRLAVLAASAGARPVRARDAEARLAG